MRVSSGSPHRRFRSRLVLEIVVQLTPASCSAGLMRHAPCRVSSTAVGAATLSLLLAPPFLVDTAAAPPRSSGPPFPPAAPGALSPLSTRSTASRGPYPPQLVRKPREEEINRAFAGRRRRKCADASQGGRSARLRGSQGGGSARLRGVLCAAAASTSTFLRIAACLRNRGQATTS